MSSPSLTGTWSGRGNAPFPDVTTANNIAYSWFWSLKSHLLATISTGTTGGVVRDSTNTWGVWGSSNGTTTSLGGVGTATDLWTTTFTTFLALANKSAAEGTSHCWITLQSPAALGPVYLTINLNSATVTTGHIYWSRTAPTGGTTTNAPTQTKGVSCTGTAFANTNTRTYVNDLTVSGSHQSHFSINSTGAFNYLCNRVGVGWFNTLFCLFLTTETRTGDTHPIWSISDMTNSGRGSGSVSTVATIGNNGFNQSRDYSNSVDTQSQTSAGSVLSWGSSTTYFAGLGSFDNATSNYIALPVYIAGCAGDSVSTVYTGWRGRGTDLWWGGGTVGGSWPNTTSPTQVLAADMLIPMPVNIGM
jgi:hypothetical protein